MNIIQNLVEFEQVMNFHYPDLYVHFFEGKHYKGFKDFYKATGFVDDMDKISNMLESLFDFIKENEIKHTMWML